MGFRRGIALAVPALLAAGFAALPAPAAARTDNDLCAKSGAGVFVGDNGFGRVCEEKFEIPAARTVRREAERFCPDRPISTRIVSSDQDVAHWGWEYWTLHGQWITWNGTSTVHRFQNVNTGRIHGRGIAPSFHNWAVWGWQVRVFWTCEPTPSASASGGPNATRAAESPNDVIIGGGGDNVQSGGAGDDEEFGRGGDDRQDGGAGDDELHGEAGDDRENGGSGDDQLLGGKGDDVSNGGRGSDELFDDEGNDTLEGGPGNDRFSARDKTRDVIRCGSGRDIVIADRRDEIDDDCEFVFRRPSEDPKKPPKV